MLPDNEFFKKVNQFGAVPDFGIISHELQSILSVLNTSSFVWYVSWSKTDRPPKIKGASGFLRHRFDSYTQALVACEYLTTQHKVQDSPIQSHWSKKGCWIHLYTMREQKA